MADEATTGLLVSIEARTAQFEKALARIEKQSSKGFAAIKKSADDNMRAVEKTLDRANAFERRMSAIDRGFIGFGKSLLPSLGAITAALSVREVAAYADAWTRAKNSLAVAGITGEEQAKVLDELYSSAQRNAAPLGAMADLFGKAAQASDNLGASNADLLKFSDGVATALRVAGTSATEASGALTQLGQLLGSSRVQAEEFNSVNEGARPILMAVAAGLDAAGGSVSKLKQLVNEGEVSGRAFFEAFLRGLPKIQAMAANSTQTIEMGVTKITNAFTRYIGQTDESLGASQRLVAGMNALADDFDKTADTALQFASVLAGALVGRSIAGMLSVIPQAVSAVVALSTAMRAGAVSAALLTRALGPIGLIVGAATAAAYAFGDFTTSVDDGTRALADQAASAIGVEDKIADVATAQRAYEQAIANTAGTQSSASASIIASTKAEFEAKKSLLELELKRQKALIAVQQAELSTKSAALKAEIGNQVLTRDSSVASGFSDPKIGDFVRRPDSMTGLEKTQAAIDASPLTNEIKRIRAEMDLATINAEKLDNALSTTFGGGTTGGSVKPSDAAAPSASGTGKKSKGGGSSRADEYQRMVERIKEATAATVAETDAQAALNPLIEDFGFAADKARAEQELLTAAMGAGKEITPALKAEIEALADSYALAEAESRNLKDAQDEIRSAAEDWASASKDAVKGFITDMRNGSTAGEAFGNVLTKIGDRMLDLALNALFSPKGTGGSIAGGLLGGLGSLLGFADGGFTSDGNNDFIGKSEVLE